MKALVFICVLILILFSGCLDIISTKQKQDCLTATDYSRTSIYDCNKVSTCFKKVNSAGFVISEKVPFETKNKLLTYKNNIATSIYYFNKADTAIQKIYGYCSGEKDALILEYINNLFFYISKVFNYQDQAWQESIEILKDYTIYLKNNDVEKITEEDIYSDFVLLNKNLNELRDESIGSDCYISVLKTEAKNARDLASSFGFLKSYMSNVNYVDIYAYYYDYIENPEQELKIPVISKSSDYVFAKLSTFENFRRINNSLSRSDNYNLYILFDKHIGTNDSLFKRFIELNNKINLDLDKTFDKIANLEIEIDGNVQYLDSADAEIYEEYKVKFADGTLGFGSYLAKLKELELNMQDNKIIDNGEQNIINRKLVDCNEVITDAKKYDNLYFKNLVLDYETEENSIIKLEYCQKIKDSLNQKNCFKDYAALVEAGHLADMDINSETRCLEVLNQLNYNLENNDKISLFFELISVNEKLIKNITKLDLSFEKQIIVEDYKETLENYGALNNYEIILNTNDYLSELNKMNVVLLDLLKEAVSKYFENNYEINFVDGGYVLKLENPSATDIDTLCFEPADVNLSEIESRSSKLKISNTEICVSDLTAGTNEFEINYSNQKIVTTRIIRLSLDKSLLEMTIKNTTCGLEDSLNLGQVELVDSINYVLDNAGMVQYISQKENKILYYSDILEETILDKNVTLDSENATLNTTFKIKNKYPGEACGDLSLIDCVDCAAQVKINGVVVNSNLYNDYEKLSVTLCFKEDETKIIEISSIQNTDQTNIEMQDFLTRINVLNNCGFEDIENRSKTELGEIFTLLSSKDYYSFEEINKVYGFEEKLSTLEKEYKERQQLLDNTNILISEISQMPLTTQEESELSQIEGLIDTDTKGAQEKARALKQKIENRLKSQENTESLNFENKVKDLIEIGKTFGIIDDKTITELNGLNFSDIGENKLANIEKEINTRIKEKSEEANLYLSYFSEINKNDILDIIDEVNWVYSDITLEELYSVKYYPIISLDDALRLKKKLNYLDTVSFKDAEMDFSNSYVSGDYVNSLKNINLVDIERLKDLNSEINLVTNGLLQFKEDADNEFNELSNTKISKEKENIAAFSEIKEDYEARKYLDVIRESRILRYQEVTAPKINYQLFTMFGLFAIVAVVAIYFGKKTPKKLTKEEKKQKILRHY